MRITLFGIYASINPISMEDMKIAAGWIFYPKFPFFSPFLFSLSLSCLFSFSLSPRVLSNGFDMTNARSAVWVNGTINDPSKGSTSWTVEIAFPISGLVSFCLASFLFPSPFSSYIYFQMVNQSKDAQPKDKGYWRINFSRVEWQVTVGMFFFFFFFFFKIKNDPCFPPFFFFPLS